jgi:hypothetical protein
MRFKGGLKAFAPPPIPQVITKKSAIFDLGSSPRVASPNSLPVEEGSKTGSFATQKQTKANRREPPQPQDGHHLNTPIVYKDSAAQGRPLAAAIGPNAAPCALRRCMSGEGY